MGRIFCFDYGRARIGAARSDERKIIASPFQVFARQKKIQNTYTEIEKKIGKFPPIESIVVGLPLLLSGEEGEMALEAKSFGQGLSAHLSIPCIFWDERLSSSQIDRMLKEGAFSRKERAALSDTLSATLILQSYLDFQSLSQARVKE